MRSNRAPSVRRPNTRR